AGPGGRDGDQAGAGGEVEHPAARDQVGVVGDERAVAAVALNAEANGVRVAAELGDILDGDAGDAEVVLAGDVFYSEAMARRMLRFLLRAARSGARVLVGDPGRAFLPRERFHQLAAYEVPVTEALESVRVKHTTVWELDPAPPGAAR
ncbi:class I SAM-dependent methyltransferase, partial [Micromonospora sp. NPDC003776]